MWIYRIKIFKWEYFVGCVICFHYLPVKKLYDPDTYSEHLWIYVIIKCIWHLCCILSWAQIQKRTSCILHDFVGLCLNRNTSCTGHWSVFIALIVSLAFVHANFVCMVFFYEPLHMKSCPSEELRKYILMWVRMFNYSTTTVFTWSGTFEYTRQISIVWAGEIIRVPETAFDSLLSITYVFLLAHSYVRLTLRRVVDFGNMQRSLHYCSLFLFR